ncbi:hypothetical protein RHSIM_Rhsim08G0125300 [Rhododendron simsii]|uniref:DUF1308 domain-containing protein n=1 Tax=Rhododendron simsii TaxID=118357 RepID=A0A834GH87_RHOSS|nr:hypothetical protein RHSIM_Rhsim08G0125300 [Rhododendron simsii]
MERGSLRETEETWSRGVIEIERAKQRCRAVIDGLLSTTTLPPNPNRTLLRLAHSELSFLSRFPHSHPFPISLSSNIGHLEAVVRILQHPFVKGVSRVCKPVSLSPPLVSLQNGGHNTAKKSVHVDIVCTLNGNPVWFLVSARNPKFVSWDGGSCQNNKGLRTRIQQVVDAAAHSDPSTKPYSIILFFSNGLDESVRANLEREFGASELGIEFPVSDFGFSEELEDGWIYIHERSLRLNAYILEIKVDHTREDLEDECLGLNLGASFCSLISRMKPHPLDLKDAEFAREKGISGESDMINFDTTALIALVSGISNGGTEKILSTSERELRLRFKSNYEFVIAQVMSEIQNPIHVELDAVLSGKRGMICERVCSEFKELVLMCGGENEKSRAGHLLKCIIMACLEPYQSYTFLSLGEMCGWCLMMAGGGVDGCIKRWQMGGLGWNWAVRYGSRVGYGRGGYGSRLNGVVPDSPSTRMMSLPNTRKLAFKNKVCFGTGDHWRAPTLTANMALVRAISQTGMSLFTIGHRPRALTGD